MKRVTPIFFLLFAATVAVLLGSLTNKGQTLTPHAAAQAPNPACVPPMQSASTPEQTAWQLFVAASCPVNNGQYPYVVWENWIEQAQLYGGSQAEKAFLAKERPRFHMSPLARIIQEEEKKSKKPIQPELLMPEAANQGCNSKTWSKRTICEEARLNPDAQAYVVSQKLVTKKGQVDFINAGKTFVFPPPSVEIKADWIQLSSCSNPPQGVHVEMINGTCYALGGMHLISKLIDKWIWATFEPQNAITNPQRCVVLGCNDSWGSNPPTSSGTDTQLTSGLATLMTQANLAPEWRNYRLDGVQVDFMNGSTPTRLGNSIIEGDNAGNPDKMKISSCITCHDFSTINKAAKSMPPAFVTGTPTIKPGFVTRDFVWSLAQAK